MTSESPPQTKEEQASAGPIVATKTEEKQEKTMREVVKEIEAKQAADAAAGITPADTRPAWLQAWSMGCRGGPPTEFSGKIYNPKTGKCEHTTLRYEYGEIVYDSRKEVSQQKI